MAGVSSRHWSRDVRLNLASGSGWFIKHLPLLGHVCSCFLLQLPVSLSLSLSLSLSDLSTLILDELEPCCSPPPRFYCSGLWNSGSLPKAAMCKLWPARTRHIKISWSDSFKPSNHTRRVYVAGMIYGVRTKLIICLEITRKKKPLNRWELLIRLTAHEARHDSDMYEGVVCQHWSDAGVGIKGNTRQVTAKKKKKSIIPSVTQEITVWFI